MELKEFSKPVIIKLKKTVLKTVRKYFKKVQICKYLLLFFFLIKDFLKSHVAQSLTIILIAPRSPAPLSLNWHRVEEERERERDRENYTKFMIKI